MAQMEASGQPVPANTFIALNHVNTCTMLCTDVKVVKNKYGGEYLVCANTATSIAKGVWGRRIGSAVGVGNHFAFTTAEASAEA